VGTDRRSVTPRPVVEGVDTRFTVVAGGHPMGDLVILIGHLDVVLIQGAGGGEVSGGGTHYM
jgi:hypothetical protein